MRTLLVTGGAGFIGSCFVRRVLRQSDTRVINLDSLTYAGSLAAVPTDDARHVFVHGDIADQQLVQSLLDGYVPDAIVNFAAETHVDRSIDSPLKFAKTNVLGTCNLLSRVQRFFDGLNAERSSLFRFLHVSTDEVFGSLGPSGRFFENTAYAPNSPYSASKAAADHFVRAFHMTYGLPTLITHCSNNYGPFQNPEKLIPLMVLAAIRGEHLPVYGDGLYVRDWLYVEDHCAALDAVLTKGLPGETYNIGGDNERRNIDVVKTVCTSVDRLCPNLPHRPCESLIRHVGDRPGHDRRYSVDCAKIRNSLGWEPQMNFDEGIEHTVQWYLDNLEWANLAHSGEYRRQCRTTS